VATGVTSPPFGVAKTGHGNPSLPPLFLDPPLHSCVFTVSEYLLYLWGDNVDIKYTTRLLILN